MTKTIAYIATDKNGKTYLYSSLPVKALESYLSCNVMEPIKQEEVDFDLPKFEDGPIKVEFVLKKADNEEKGT